MSQQTKQLTPKELREFSGEHLFYEIKMLYGVRDIILKTPKNVYIFNALLESMVIHTSNILDFFYKPRIKADDAKATDYMKDHRRWKTVMPPYDRYFRKFSRKRNRALVHLSYKRLEIKGADKHWYTDKTTEHIRRLVNLFLKEADPELLHPRIQTLVDK